MTDINPKKSFQFLEKTFFSTLIIGIRITQKFLNIDIRHCFGNKKKRQRNDDQDRRNKLQEFILHGVSLKISI